METNIVIFLLFITVACTINVGLIWLIYKALAGVTAKVTESVSNFTVSGEAKAWISTLQSMSEQAVAVTESTKIKIAEVEPMIERAQQSYHDALADVDSRLETLARQITTSARKARDLMAGPATSVLAFAAGLTDFLRNFDSDE